MFTQRHLQNLGAAVIFLSTWPSTAINTYNSYTTATSLSNPRLAISVCEKSIGPECGKLLPYVSEVEDTPYTSIFRMSKKWGVGEFCEDSLVMKVNLTVPKYNYYLKNAEIQSLRDGIEDAKMCIEGDEKACKNVDKSDNADLVCMFNFR